MSYTNFSSDIDLALSFTDSDGFVTVNFPSPDLHEAILNKGYKVVAELTEFTIYRRSRED